MIIDKGILFLKAFYRLIIDTFHKFNDDNVIKLGASLSYYTLFSLPPLLIIIIALSGIFFGEDAMRGELVEQIEGVVGHSTAIFIQNTLSNIQLSYPNGWTAIISSGVLLFTASTVFAEIQSSINTIWGLKTKPNKGLRKFIFNRLVSFSMIVSMGFILMVSLLLNGILKVISAKLLLFLDIDQLNLVFLINSSISFLIICLLFTVIFKSLPDAKIRLRDAFLGSFFTSLLFLIGKYFIGYYLSTTNLSSVYGATASVAILLVWVYYSAIILYFGAVFTKVYTDKYGQKIIPNTYTFLVIKTETELSAAEIKSLP
ncbi:MAG: YihY/virulence factor BrkB family protein [Chitinophagales bacterium]|nr:YihY/virulence factor BrkB family protein [Chitinophagales bacterium]